MCSGCNSEYSEFRKQDRFKYLDNEQVQILVLHDILETLTAMKKQEFDYWEAWKLAKNKEQTTKEANGQ